MRATALAPSEWRKRLEAVNKIDDASNENSNANCILLDVRNGIPLPYLLGMVSPRIFLAKSGLNSCVIYFCCMCSKVGYLLENL